MGRVEARCPLLGLSFPGGKNLFSGVLLLERGCPSTAKPKGLPGAQGATALAWIGLGWCSLVFRFPMSQEGLQIPNPIPDNDRPIGFLGMHALRLKHRTEVDHIGFQKNLLTSIGKRVPA